MDPVDIAKKEPGEGKAREGEATMNECKGERECKRQKKRERERDDLDMRHHPHANDLVLDPIRSRRFVWENLPEPGVDLLNEDPPKPEKRVVADDG